MAKGYASIRSYPPVQGDLAVWILFDFSALSMVGGRKLTKMTNNIDGNNTHGSYKHSGSGFVEDYKGKISAKMAKHKAGWMGSSVSEGLIGLY